ncbi:MAG: hypothetical protein M1812_001693 [Candelaria pacifica]|nr:MAG: hypothetical protein M1812_001693 [Candelaria pacifica]
MTLLSKTLNSLGLLLLIHACYSAHEYSSLPISVSSGPTGSTISSLGTSPRNSVLSGGLSGGVASVSTNSKEIKLPLDITLETLFAVAVLCVGLVLGSERFKPVQWRVWAGEVQRGRGGVGGAEGMDGGVGNPFEGLEVRKGFLDIRARRREFAEWVKEQNSVDEKS